MNEMRGDSVPVSSASRALPALIFLFVTVVAGLWLADRFTSPEGMAFVGSEPTASATVTASPSGSNDAPTSRNPKSEGQGPGHDVDPHPVPDQRWSRPVSERPDDAEPIVVPALVELSTSEAREKLKVAGWSGTLEVEKIDTLEPSMDKKIAEQDPQPDEKIDPEATIRVRVSVLIEPSEPVEPTDPTVSGPPPGG